MSDERDPFVSQRYRELGSDEPSPELDRVIVGAARRATSRYRWYPSLAAAAVLLFAVAIAFHIEREPAPSEPAAMAPDAEQRAAEVPTAPPAATPQSRVERKVSPPPRAASARRFTPEPPAAPPSANANMQAPPEAAAADMARRAAPSAAPMAAKARLEQTPEQWLERIARLREQGRDDEANKEMARFRERYPDYRIPEAMAKRVAPSPAR